VARNLFRVCRNGIYPVAPGLGFGFSLDESFQTKCIPPSAVGNRRSLAFGASLRLWKYGAYPRRCPGL